MGRRRPQPVVVGRRKGGSESEWRDHERDEKHEKRKAGRYGEKHKVTKSTKGAREGSLSRGAAERV